MKKILVASMFATLAALAPSSQAETGVPVKTFDVFVDKPTGFTFVKMPSGWKFVGQLPAGEIASLPPGVITSLLPSEQAPTQVAQQAQPTLR